MDADLLALLGKGGIVAALLGLIYLVGMRLVKAIDGLGAKVVDHTAKDLEHHGMVREELVAVSTKIDLLFEQTPVDMPKRRTNPRGVPIGEYGFGRTKGRGEDER